MYPNLIIGTANFGSPYGFKKEFGAVSHYELEKIRNSISKNTIKGLDTAIDYNGSEEVIGQVFNKISSLSIYTKLGTKIIKNSKTIESNLENSLNKLKRQNLAGVLLRDFSTLEKKIRNDAIEVLSDLKCQRKIAKLGITVYSLEELENSLNLYSNFDLIQVPENIVDRRLVHSNLLNTVSKSGIEIHVRSLFLQGTLLADFSAIPSKISSYFDFIKELKKLSKKLDRSILQLCIDYGTQIEWGDALVIGVGSNKELIQIMQAFRNVEKIDFSNFPKASHLVIDPRNWNKL